MGYDESGERGMGLWRLAGAALALTCAGAASLSIPAADGLEARGLARQERRAGPGGLVVRAPQSVFDHPQQRFRLEGFQMTG